MKAFIGRFGVSGLPVLLSVGGDGGSPADERASPSSSTKVAGLLSLSGGGGGGRVDSGGTPIEIA